MRIKENIILVITAVMLLCCTSAWADSFTLTDWQFDPYGTADTNDSTLITNINELIFTGWSLKNTTPSTTTAGTGTFETYGVFSVKDFTNLDKASLANYGLNTTNYELTFVLETSGYYTTPVGSTAGTNDLTFTSATLTFYLDTDTDINYATLDPDSIYGANDGDKIAVFNLLDGYGIFNYQKDDKTLSTYRSTVYPDGPIDITFIADYLAAGYWFDSDGNDLAAVLDSGTEIVFGLTDSNSQDKTRDGTYPTATVAGELNATDTGLSTDTSKYPYISYISSDGSFGLATTPIPEPTSLFLFGSGLIGLGFLGRKRFMIA